MKPDIVFFGEGLSDEFHEALANDKDVCDLLIVMGSSLKVRPVAMIPSSIPTNVPQILINREPLKHLTFDIELLGDCDVIIGEICHRLETEWVIDEDIPRSQLKEIPISVSSKRSAVVANEAVSLDSAEVNNNFESSSSQAETYDPSNIPPSEESNSCDCRGLSSIKLSDSEDGSNQEQPPIETSSSKKNESDFEDVYDSKHIWPTSSRESISKRLPDDSYLYFPPSRYIFKGAEVYRDGEDDDCCSTPTDYSSDCGSPQRPPLDDSTGDISNEISSPHFPPVRPVAEQAHTADESSAKSEQQEESPKT
ncbi:NAD-dependent protein deacetylase sirtuin-1-like [Stegodyphus dumicola]|uniref:NAD-dependent protein deacetylase sirtuin-1-like n=1 Tax=Stegodyphus dumicola TaxID=202533 RepID=UPI0015B33DA8|nr:NAD-dependent protein deacetylase sirtuin-1-like [Stegodyphus dumicola]